jgi:multidrug efflux system outer membrane protein
MEKKYSFTILMLAVCVVFNSCKLPSIAENSIKKELPPSFQNVQDTSNSANYGWKSFYLSPMLVDLIDTVLVNNPDMMIAAQRIIYANAQNKQAKGLAKPFLNATLLPNLRKFGLYTMDGAGNIVTDIETGKPVPIDLPDYYGGFQASWEVDLWGKLKNKRQAALARILASNAYRHLVQTNLIAETANAYYELLAAEQELKILDETILLQDQALELMRIQKEAAAVNELAVQQFEAQSLGMKSLRIEIAQQLFDAELRIQQLAGRTKGMIRKDSVFFTSGLIPKVKSGLPSELLLNRPDIRQAEMELIASKADVRAARAAFLPSLMISGNLGMQAYAPRLLTMFPESIAYGIFGGMTAPLLNRSNIQAEFSKATAVQMENLWNYQKTITKGFWEVEQELKRNTNLSNLFQMKQKETNALSNAANISSELFKTGRSNYLEVLFTRQSQLRANLELITTRKNQLITSVNLYKAIGGGWK